MGQNELITGWVYKNGELLRRRIREQHMALTLATALALSLAAAWPIINWEHSIKEKLGGWIFFMHFILLAILSNFLLKILSGTVFAIYKKVFGVKEEEIIFTNHKITSTNKTWILNDENNTLTSVSFSTADKSPGLQFKGRARKEGRTAGKYSIDIPVPYGELLNAEKICNYFKERLISA